MVTGTAAASEVNKMLGNHTLKPQISPTPTAYCQLEKHVCMQRATRPQHVTTDLIGQPLWLYWCLVSIQLHLIMQTLLINVCW